VQPIKNAIYPSEQLALVKLEKLLLRNDLRQLPQRKGKISLPQKSVKLAND
jgi:hypothetical protein